MGVYRGIGVVRRVVALAGGGLLVLTVVHLAVGVLLEVGDEVLAEGGSISGDFTALNSVPDGDVLVLDGDALAGERVDFVGMVECGVLVLADVLLAVGVLVKVAREVATQGSGVACYLATLSSVPYGDVFCLLLWAEHCGHEGGGVQG